MLHSEGYRFCSAWVRGCACVPVCVCGGWSYGEDELRPPWQWWREEEGGEVIHLELRKCDPAARLLKGTDAEPGQTQETDEGQKWTYSNKNLRSDTQIYALTQTLTQRQSDTQIYTHTHTHTDLCTSTHTKTHISTHTH